MIVGQNGDRSHSQGESPLFVIVCAASFPGAPVIVGHARPHLTRMTHDPRFLLHPAGASYGKWDEL
jgi:hypothetical protein